MNSNHDEEMKFHLPVDEPDSDDNHLTHYNCWQAGDYLDAWEKVSDRALKYIRWYNESDLWFDNRLYGITHTALGLALRVFDIDISRGWVNSSIAYCNHQWNRLLSKYNNALTRVIMTRVRARGRRNVTQLFDLGFSDESMCSVIKQAITLVFDAQYPDATSQREIARIAAHPDRDNIYCAGAHACFSIADNDTNVCWLSGTVYDDYLCHFFRTALFHALAFFKYDMNDQKYYVSENMQLDQFKSGRKYCRKVVLAFSIESHSPDRQDSSDEEPEPDDDAKRDDDQEDEHEVNADEVEEEYEHGEEDRTFRITYNSDSTITTYRPPQFTRINQVVNEEIVIAESDQMEGLVDVLIPLLDLVQLGRISRLVTQRIRELTGQQHTVQPAVTEPSNFFNTTSFSSGSEGEEE